MRPPMSSDRCEEFQESMDRFFDRDAAPQPELLEHLDHCEDCARTFAFMGRLRGAELYPEPSDADFLALRRGVIRDIRRTEARGPSFLESVTAFFRRPAVLMGCTALAVGFAFLAGRSTGKQPLQVKPRPFSEDALLAEIKLAASQNQGIQDFDKARYTYENVRVDELGSDRVGLSFDISRHVTLSLQKQDPLVVDVLSQTLVGTSPVGTKLQAIEAADGHLEPKVRDGLIQVMLTDTNLGVRLKAQEKLLEQTGDTKVQEALLSVLQTAESVQMRLLAIDHLTRQRISPDRLRQALAPAGRHDAVTLKAMNYLNENGGFQ